MAIAKQELESFLKEAYKLEDEFIQNFQDDFIEEFLHQAALDGDSAYEIKKIFTRLRIDSERHYKILASFYELVTSSNKHEF